MDSMPPATMISALWQARRSWANIAAFIPEPHILFTVVQPADSGRPAPSEAWRAGAWPWPAGSTQPMITSCTSSGLSFARSTAARMAAAPSSGAAKPFSSPWKAPIGVRAAETMTIGSGFMEYSFQIADCFNGFGFQPRDEFARRQRPREGRSPIFSLRGVLIFIWSRRTAPCRSASAGSPRCRRRSRRAWRRATGARSASR